MRREGRQGGFSLIEVLVAVTIFIIAFAAILALMLTTVRANASANAGTDAMGVAERFLEELRLRQSGWRGLLPLATEACELNITENEWTLPLGGATGATCISGSPWMDGAAHDVEGRAAAHTAVRKAIYCVHYRTEWQPTQTVANPSPGGSDEVMVTVRVAYTADGSQSWANCQPATVAAALASGGNARAVIVSTMLRKQPPQ